MLKLSQISTYTYSVYGIFKTGKNLEVQFVVTKTGKLMKHKGIVWSMPEYEEFLDYLRDKKLISF